MVEECNQLSFSSLSLISLWRLFSSQVIEDPFHPLLLLLLYKLNKRTIRLNVNNKTVPILKGDKSRIAKWGIEKESIKLEAFENQQGVTHKKKSTWTIRNQRRRSVRRNPTVRLLARRHARWLALKKKKKKKIVITFFLLLLLMERKWNYLWMKSLPNQNSRSNWPKPSLYSFHPTEKFSRGKPKSPRRWITCTHYAIYKK